MSVVDLPKAKFEFPKLSVPNGLGTGPIPIAPYISQDWYEQERDRVFGRARLCMRRVEQLPEADSFMVEEVEICELIALITRDANVGEQHALGREDAHAAGRQRFQQEHHACRMAEIFLEDVGNLERQQREMESGGKTEIIQQDGEFLLRHSIETIQKWVASATVRAALT